MIVDTALRERENAGRPIPVGMVGAGATGRAIALQLGTPVQGPRLVAIANRRTIMVGERPKTETFEQLFDWPDSVVDLPYDSTDIDAVMSNMDRQPERMENIRRTNVTQALLRHDWAYRWEAILQAIGFAPMPGLSAKKGTSSATSREHLEAIKSDRRFAISVRLSPWSLKC